ncbi:MAG: hypothetical protein ACJAUP_000101 [Cellvibrionaceae bacterium]|jgi:hypothetical protein
MAYNYPFESVLVRNRLGQGMTLQVYSFSLSNDQVCVLVKVPEGSHHSLLAKNAENVVFLLRERFSRTVKNFSMIELRVNSSTSDGSEKESWYGWQFNWVGNTPIDSKSQLLTQQKIDYYQGKIAGFDQASV